MLLQLVLLVVFYALAKHLVRKARNLPPSPFPELPIIGHLYLTLKNPMHKTLMDISKRHGPITFLQLGSHRVLLISSPSAVEECLSTNDIVFANRPRFLAGKYNGYDHTSLAWTPYGDRWRNLRKISSLEILSYKSVNKLQGIRAEEVRSFVERLASSRDGTVNMKNALFELIYNVMMRMVAGKRSIGENAKGVEEVQSIVRDSFGMTDASFLGDYLPFLRWIGYRGLEKRLKLLKAKRDVYMQALIEENRGKDSSEGGTRKTMIRTLLSLQEGDPESFTDVDIRSMMLVMLSAGIDTSSSTLEWALSLLLNHPRVLTMAQSEIDKVVGFDRLMNEHDLEKLPYLHCIISETLRMYPPGPLIPHESSNECRVGGYRIPRGTMLLINVYEIQRDDRNWANASEYRPERFEGAVDPSAREHGFRMLPFGYGRRGCPGENLALRMVGLTLGTVIQCFDLRRIGDEQVDMEMGGGLTMPKAKPLLAKCKPRAFLADILVPK